MMTITTAPHAQIALPAADERRIKPIGTINAANGDFSPLFWCNGCSLNEVSAQGILCPECVALGVPPKIPATIPAFFPGGDNSTPEHIPFENPGENPAEKKSRSYTKRVEIGGKCVLVTLHDDSIELREKWGRKRAVWTLEKLWDAAEGKLL
jgi:hypothetical protein